MVVDKIYGWLKFLETNRIYFIIRDIFRFHIFYLVTINSRVIGRVKYSRIFRGGLAVRAVPYQPGSTRHDLAIPLSQIFWNQWISGKKILNWAPNYILSAYNRISFYYTYIYILDDSIDLSYLFILYLDNNYLCIALCI